jgi:enamine deaminase RidA (YjgF/YER057c/UK114 family)
MTALPRAIEPDAFPWANYAGATFALGLTVGADVLNSGHSGAVLDPDSGRMTVAGGMGEQADVAYAKQEAILAAAGLGWADVTRVVENVTIEGLAHRAEAEEVRRRIFAGHEPTVVTVVVDRLVRRRAWLEVEVHASPGGGDALVVGSGSGQSWLRRDTVRQGHDGAVYLPMILPVADDGSVIAEGDVVGQYFACLERAGELLERAGLDLSNVVSTVDYSTPATRERYPKTGRARRDLLGPVYPGAAGILVSQLHAPGVLVALEIVASRHVPVQVNPGWSRYETLTYNPGVRAGNTLYMSGFAALDMDCQLALHPGDVRGQAEVTYDAMLQTMAAVGAGPQHTLTTVEYVVPDALPSYRAVADVRRSRLAPPYPASTGIVCGGLLRDEFLIEVVPTALVPGEASQPSTGSGT